MRARSVSLDCLADLSLQAQVSEALAIDGDGGGVGCDDLSSTTSGHVGVVGAGGDTGADCNAVEHIADLEIGFGECGRGAIDGVGGFLTRIGVAALDGEDATTGADGFGEGEFLVQCDREGEDAGHQNEDDGEGDCGLDESAALNVMRKCRAKGFDGACSAGTECRILRSGERSQGLHIWSSCRLAEWLI